MTKTPPPADFDLMQLVEKIRGFDYEDATPTENAALARALKLVAEDTLRRHDDVRQMQTRLKEKIQVAETAAELAGVVHALTRPEPEPRRGWFK